jgi:hypothetical protein
MQQIRTKLSYANVLSTICLFLVLGGGAAYAATQVPKNSVGAKQLRKNSVTAAKIKNGAVSASKLSGATVAALQTPADPLQVVKVEGAKLVLGPGDFDGAPLAQCPAGYLVVGTGFFGGVAEPGFVLSFGSFVGGFFANESSIVTESNVQAICGKTAGGASASGAENLERFHREVARAKAASGS